MRRGAWFLAALSIGFFALTSWLGRPVASQAAPGAEPSALWNSPDEAANAYWSAQVAAGRQTAIHDVIVGIGAGSVHPRSMAVVSDALVPGSFPGLILMFGALKLLVRLPFHLVTPLLTALAGLLFGALMTKLFDRRVGFWSGALFLIQPAVFYYTARGLFHNMLCVDLLVIAASFLVLQPLRGRFGRSETLDDVLGGFFFAWAMLTRASEVVWALPAFALFLPFAGAHRWRRVTAMLLGAALPAFLFLFVNASLYGSPFRTGYNPPPVAAPAAAVVAPTSNEAASTAPVAITFGFHPRLILAHAWTYGALLFWWITALTLVGIVWWLIEWKHARPSQRMFAAVAAVVVAWLAAFYGSWLLFDRFDPDQVSIGVSYVRYFLPAYVVLLPFAAFALARASRALGRWWVAPALFVVCAFLSLRLAVLVGDESLRQVHLTLEGNAEKKRVLLAAIPPEAVVMTERFDKLLVPERLRLITSTDPGSFRAARNAAAFVPVYWYGLDPLNAEFDRLKAAASVAGLRFGPKSSPVAGEALYPLTPTP